MLWLAKFFLKKPGQTGKSLKDAIAYFFKLNNRMPNNLETIKIKNAFMDQTRKSNVIDITSRIKDEWWKERPGFKRQHPEVTKKIKESDDLIRSFEQTTGEKVDKDTYSALLERQSKELEGIDTKQGTGFYSDMSDIMKKHDLEQLEFKYDEMFNKILEKAKRIERDPKVLLEAELGTKLTGEETTTQLLDLFSKRPKKASGGIARVGYAAGKIVKGGAWIIKNLKKSRKEVIEGKGQFSKLNPMEQEQLKWELNALIKQLERGGAIPDDMIQTMRQDKRFKDIVKTPSTDTELRELEEVLLGKTDMDRMRDIEQKINLEEFDVTGKTKHASGGIAGQLHLNRPGYAQGRGPAGGLSASVPDVSLNKTQKLIMDKALELMRTEGLSGFEAMDKAEAIIKKQIFVEKGGSEYAEYISEPELEGFSMRTRQELPTGPHSDWRKFQVRDYVEDDPLQRIQTDYMHSPIIEVKKPTKELEAAKGGLAKVLGV